MAQKRFHLDVDLVNNALLRAKLYPLSTVDRLALPLLPQDEGLASYDTTLNTVFLWDGTQWIELVTAGNADANYVHDQASPSATWTIAHNLGKFPSVTVVDTANTEVVGKVDHTDINNLIITFNGAFSGKAFLN